MVRPRLPSCHKEHFQLQIFEQSAVFAQFLPLSFVRTFLIFERFNRVHFDYEDLIDCLEIVCNGDLDQPGRQFILIFLIPEAQSVRRLSALNFNSILFRPPSHCISSRSSRPFIGYLWLLTACPGSSESG
mmetsp:Transcript_42698/g.114300  ORF Transcript_42698/g.114300 Transcript_42698/m.114300 type:complete len:130 (+) Transcript_42698:645-1034(+)